MPMAVSLWTGVIALLLVHRAATSECNVSRSDGNTIVDCYRKILSAIPTTVPDDTKSLNFSSNTIRNLAYNGMLSRFFNLRVSIS